MYLIGREDETERLSALADNNNRICVSGREGVGKTAFLYEFCMTHDGIYFCTSPGGYRSNVRSLSERLGVGDGHGDVEGILKEYSIKSPDRRMVAIDDALRMKEIEDLVPPENIVLILCDRGIRDADIVLGPFGLRESGAFFPDFMPREKLLIHTVTGGVPGYMTMFDRGMSVAGTIGSLFFSRNGRLVNEPERLLRNMGIREPDGYISLMAAMAEGADTLNAMVRESDDGSTAAVSRRLETLVGTFVSRDVPDGKVRASYRISDGMTGFWMRFVRPRIGTIMSGRQDIFEDEVEDAMDGYLSEVFSGCCSAYMEEGYGIRPGPWTPIDGEGRIFSCRTDGDESYFISCTWSKRPVGRDGLDALRSFAGRKAPGRKRNYVMFSAGGFKRDMEQVSETEDVDLIPLEGMFW
ncbi:MAG: ATP-binding protein [Candidatus Methanomethylophilaceae archaeon]